MAQGSSGFTGPYGLVVGAVLGAAASAAYFHEGAKVAPPPAATAPAPPLDTHQDDDEAESALPPNHPPIGAAGSATPHGAMGANAGADEAPAIVWKLPEGWQVAPNTSAMRIATYKVTGKDGDADVSVARAGGDTTTNIARWVDQFGGTATPVKTEKTVAGFKVTTVELTGTFAGGAMGGASDSKKNWALLGAIVETPGSAYFFKMTGPEGTVTGARASFRRLIDGLAPAK